MKRRDFLAAAGCAALGASAASRSAIAQNGAGVRLVIVGAGAAGLSLAARFSRALNNAKIIVIDARKLHVFQPGLTMVGAGL
ncbi:MAG TPA: pyridine nucleotide-disulfide oxidoreductase, partial [Pusillimonas sp.]|nr:pyridine nucleotide-disulfide oxidoreductase [Pusillimonas sp.]